MLFGGAVSDIAYHGAVWRAWLSGGFRPSAPCTPGPRSDLTPEPKVGAQCGSAARWDLSGGQAEPSRLQPFAKREGLMLRRRGLGISRAVGSMQAGPVAIAAPHRRPPLLRRDVDATKDRRASMSPMSGRRCGAANTRRLSALDFVRSCRGTSTGPFSSVRIISGANRRVGATAKAVRALRGAASWRSSVLVGLMLSEALAVRRADGGVGIVVAVGAVTITGTMQKASGTTDRSAARNVSTTTVSFSDVSFSSDVQPA